MRLSILLFGCLLAITACKEQPQEKKKKSAAAPTYTPPPASTQPPGYYDQTTGHSNCTASSCPRGRINFRVDGIQQAQTDNNNTTASSAMSNTGTSQTYNVDGDTRQNFTLSVSPEEYTSHRLTIYVRENTNSSGVQVNNNRSTSPQISFNPNSGSRSNVTITGWVRDESACEIIKGSSSTMMDTAGSTGSTSECQRYERSLSQSDTDFTIRLQMDDSDNNQMSQQFLMASLAGLQSQQQGGDFLTGMLDAFLASQLSGFGGFGQSVAGQSAIVNQQTLESSASSTTSQSPAVIAPQP